LSLVSDGLKVFVLVKTCFLSPLPPTLKVL
jgi:hypothetical protein